MTASPGQGAGTDDELREAYVSRLAGQPATTDEAGALDIQQAEHLADALLSDPGVLAAMRRREQQSAAKALRDAADELLGFGDTAAEQAERRPSRLATSHRRQRGSRPDRKARPVSRYDCRADRLRRGSGRGVRPARQ